MNQLLSRSGERRRSLRQPRLNGAMIVFNGDLSTIACVVRDLSPQGARLIVASPIGIPERVDLRIDQTGVCHPSKVAWKSAHRIGVKFLDR
jgi:PilZ domain-containing protein